MDTQCDYTITTAYARAHARSRVQTATVLRFIYRATVAQLKLKIVP